MLSEIVLCDLKSFQTTNIFLTFLLICISIWIYLCSSSVSCESGRYLLMDTVQCWLCLLQTEMTLFKFGCKVIQKDYNVTIILYSFFLAILQLLEKFKFTAAKYVSHLIQLMVQIEILSNSIFVAVPTAVARTPRLSRKRICLAVLELNVLQD